MALKAQHIPEIPGPHIVCLNIMEILASTSAVRSSKPGLVDKHAGQQVEDTKVVEGRVEDKDQPSQLRKFVAIQTTQNAA